MEIEKGTILPDGPFKCFLKPFKMLKYECSILCKLRYEVSTISEHLSETRLNENMSYYYLPLSVYPFIFGHIIVCLAQIHHFLWSIVFKMLHHLFHLIHTHTHSDV